MTQARLKKLGLAIFNHLIETFKILTDREKISNQDVLSRPSIGVRGIVFGRIVIRPGYTYGVLFSGYCLSVFVSLSPTLRENGWTDLHEIFREGVE